MEPLEQLLAVATVLLGLVLLVLFLRKRGFAQFKFSTATGGRARNMELIERLPLTAQHSLHLVRVNGDLLVLSVSATGCTLLKDTSLPASSAALAKSIRESA